MKKYLVLVSFLSLFISMTSQSWGLPLCPLDYPYKDNCYGSSIINNIGKYVGEWKNNQPHGEGVISFNNQGKNRGGQFRGKFKNGVPGKGTRTWLDGRSYSGSTKNGKFHGFGTLIFPDKEIYEGEFKNGVRHGYGELEVKLFVYKGNWKNGKMSGKGQLNFTNGDIYIGEFFNNKKDGFGKFIYKNGEILEGFFKDNIFQYEKKKTTETKKSKLEEYKSFCLDVGFIKGSEKFKECILESMKQK